MRKKNSRENSAKSPGLIIRLIFFLFSKPNHISALCMLGPIWPFLIYFFQFDNILILRFEHKWQKRPAGTPAKYINPIYVFPISTFMCLWAIYIFPGSVHIFSCSRIGRRILGIDTVHRMKIDCGVTISFLGICVSNFRYFAFTLDIWTFIHI
jgi:hypothetical protein